MIKKVKTALRINHDLLDDEIKSTIATARRELDRIGCGFANVIDDDAVQTAIKTYCLWWFASDEKKREGYFESWQYQLDNLRKSEFYRTGGV